MTAGKKVEQIGDALVRSFHLLGLFAIGALTVWAAGVALIEVFQHKEPHIKDILLLFIYLELGAMVGIYSKTHHLPVRFLLYIAITALTRVLAIDIKTMSDTRIIVITAAILLMSLAVLVVRYASNRFPSGEHSS